MTISIAFIALIAAGYMMINYMASQSRELDQIIALEDRAEYLRKRCTYDADRRDSNVRARNQVLVKIARRRKAFAIEHKLQARDINRMLVARRRT